MLNVLGKTWGIAVAALVVFGVSAWAVVEGGQPAPSDQAQAPQGTYGPVGDQPCPAGDQEGPAANKECPKGAAANELVLPEPESSPFLTEENFVMNWAVLGPFRFGAEEFGGGDQQAAADKEFMPDEGSLRGCEAAPEGTRWEVKQFTGNIQPGQVDLEALYGEIDHAAVYAVACLISPKAIDDATVWTGADDYITVWVNGQQVLKYNEKRRGSDWDQDLAEGVKLKEGCNWVVVKVTDVVGGYDFYFRLTDKDGNPMVVRPVEQEGCEMAAEKWPTGEQAAEPTVGPAQEEAAKADEPQESAQE